MQLSENQLHTVRQWFNSIEDTNQQFLNLADYTLYVEIMNELR